MSQDIGQIQQELSVWDDAFTPSEGRSKNIEDVPVGTHEFEIIDAVLEHTEKNKVLILRWELRNLKTNVVFEKANFFSKQESVDILGAELCALGIDADQWKPPSRPFSKELVKALPRLQGICFVGEKTIKEVGVKKYHNFYIKSILPNYATPPAADDKGAPF